MERGADLHFCEFRGGASGDFLDAELAQLGFEVEELFFEVFFALAPELAGFDLGSGLPLSLAKNLITEVLSTHTILFVVSGVRRNWI